MCFTSTVTLMPRRKGDEAKSKALSKAAAHIHFIVRNPQFVEDLNELRRHLANRPDPDNRPITREMIKAAERAEELIEAKRLYRQQNPSFQDVYTLFNRTWGLAWFPFKLIDSKHKEAWPKTVGELTSAILAETRYAEDETPQDFIASRIAVESWDPYDDGRWNEYEAEYGYLPPEAPIQGTLLEIRADLSFPQDILEALIREELKKAKKRRRRLRAKDGTPLPKRRQRLSSTDFQLRVYDLYQEGKDFEQIAQELEKRTLTVKGRRNSVRSAYVAAVRNIREVGHNCSEVPPISHDCDKCSICRQAKTVDDFCRTGKVQLNS